MSLYEQRLAQDLGEIRDKVADLGAAVEAALDSAMQAAQSGDNTLANVTVLNDHPINRLTRAITRLCHGFIAVHQPGAGHLRTVSSILIIVNELERIGDYAATVARETIQLPHAPEGVLREEFDEMAEQARTSLTRAVRAFNERDLDLARETLTFAAQAKGRGDAIFEDIIHESENKAEDVRYLFDLLILIGRLNRVSDRAKNICEETVFAITGETKAPKMYRVLFLDRDNAGPSQLAQAIANKTFPNSGRYASAGLEARDGLRPGLLKFMEANGLLADTVRPKSLDVETLEAYDHDVVVSLEGAIDDYLKLQPFRTVFLEWNVGRVREESSEMEIQEAYDRIYRETAARVRDLMETLRGEGTN